MKCENPYCGKEWTPPIDKIVTVCPFCQQRIWGEDKSPESLDNVADILIYIDEKLGAETLLGKEAYTHFAYVARNKFRDEAELIKQLCDNGALGCLKAAIGKYDCAYENAMKRALSKLPENLQDSQAVKTLLHDFAAALGWTAGQQKAAPRAPKIIVAPSVGSLVSFADIEWRVLAVENNKALLLSEKILEKRKYDAEHTEVTWEQCTLREYLNNEFYNNLGAEKSAVAETINDNPDNPWTGTAGGNATADKVFLLSLDEVVKYLGDSGGLAQKQSEDIKYYYYDHGVIEIPKPHPEKDCWFSDQYNENKVALYRNKGAWWWWLRSPGYECIDATYVYDDGTLDFHGYFVTDCGGVRPALWLNL